MVSSKSTLLTRQTQPAGTWRRHEIGRSVEGRPISVVRWNPNVSAGEAQTTREAQTADEAQPPVRILVLAGQHGDEPLAREAVVRVIDNLTARSESLTTLAQVQLAIIQNANPDGAATNRRLNADNVDLNRDHQRLESPETQAIHRFARQFRPDLVIDTHTFPARRKVMIRQGIVYHQDVQLDIANSLAVPKVTRKLNKRLLSNLLSRLEDSRFQADRYTLFRKDGCVRHSTPDIVDARNGLALRFGIPTLLIEGRQPSRRDQQDRSLRTRSAIESALLWTLEWAQQNRPELLQLRTRKHDLRGRVSIRSRLIGPDGNGTPERLFADPNTGEPIHFSMPTSFTPRVKSTRKVDVPKAYGIPKRCRTLLDLLARHGFQSTREIRYARAEACRLVDANESPQRRNTSRWQTDSRPNVALEDYVIFPLDPEVCGALATHLEPQAKYGLARELTREGFQVLLRFF